MGFAAALIIFGIAIYNAMSTKKKIATKGFAVYVDLFVFALGLIGWCVKFLDVLWHSSYEGSPEPPPQPWIADENVASGLIIVLLYASSY
jgi:hypothetical protein